MGGFLDSIKETFSNQPKGQDYKDPTWLQKAHSKWDQDVSYTQRKVILVAYPILTVLIIAGGAVAAYYAPVKVTKYIVTGVTLGVPALYFGAYPLCKWRWGKSYSEQTLKMEEGKLTQEKIRRFRQHTDHMLDFDIAHLSGPEKDKEADYLTNIHSLVASCTRLREAKLGRTFSPGIIQALHNSPRLKRLEIDFSETPGSPQRTEEERIAMIRAFPPTLKHLNLSMVPKDPDTVAGERDFRDVKLTAGMIDALVKTCPHLKTIQLSHLDHDSWEHFGRLPKLREITVEVKRLNEISVAQAVELNKLRNAMRDAKAAGKFKPFKEIKMIHPKLDQNHRHDDDFRTEGGVKVRDILEGPDGTFGIDKEDAKDDKETVYLRFRTTPNEWRQRFRWIWG